MPIHVNLDDRRRIYRMQAKRLPVEEIARALGRHRSTINRELRRNTYIDPEYKAYNGYFPVTAQELAN